MAEETLAGEIDAGVELRDGEDKPLRLSDPHAASKLAREARSRFTESINSTGKALAAIGGVGVFLFAIGYFIEWQQLKQADLSPQDILPLIPKEQVAAAGLRELFGSIVFGGVTLASIAVVMVWVSRATDGKSGLLGAVHWLLSREIGFPTVAFGLVVLFFVPLHKGGLVVAAVLTALLYYGLRLVKDFLARGDHEQFPLWRLLAAVAVAAVVLSTARQWEYPEPRPLAVIVLSGRTPLIGTYIGSDADKVLIERPSINQRGAVIAVRRDEIRQMVLQRIRPDFPATPSLFDKAVDPLFPGTHFSCIPLECRTATDRIGPSSFF